MIITVERTTWIDIEVFAKADLPPIGQAYNRLSESIRNWRPTYDVGDLVRAHPHGLGCDAPPGRVLGFYWNHGHLMVSTQESDLKRQYYASDRIAA